MGAWVALALMVVGATTHGLVVLCSGAWVLERLQILIDLARVTPPPHRATLWWPSAVLLVSVGWLFGVLVPLRGKWRRPRSRGAGRFLDRERDVASFEEIGRLARAAGAPDPESVFVDATADVWVEPDRRRLDGSSLRRGTLVVGMNLVATTSADVVRAAIARAFAETVPKSVSRVHEWLDHLGTRCWDILGGDDDSPVHSDDLGDVRRPPRRFLVGGDAFVLTVIGRCAFSVPCLPFLWLAPRLLRARERRVDRVAASIVEVQAMREWLRADLRARVAERRVKRALAERFDRGEPWAEDLPALCRDAVGSVGDRAWMRIRDVFTADDVPAFAPSSGRYVRDSALADLGLHRGTPDVPSGETLFGDFAELCRAVTRAWYEAGGAEASRPVITRRSSPPRSSSRDAS